MSDSDPSLRARLRRGLRNLGAGPMTWLVLLGNRLLVAALVTAAFAVPVAWVLYTHVVDLNGETQLLYLFQGLVGGNLTLLTIVLSINQLILSREFNTPGELRERIEGADTYRERVRETVGEPAVPVSPAPFLSELLDATSDIAASVLSRATEEAGEEVAAEIEAVVEPVLERATASRRRLDASAGSVFSALVVVLETNYSQPLSDARGVRLSHGDALPGAVDAGLEELIHALQRVDIARQYFKSIYLQSELARLSQLLLWVGVPAIGSAGVLLFVYSSGPSTAVPPASVRWLVAPVLVLGFAPLATLFAFVLRIATVARRTVAITPFTTAPQEQVLEEEDE